MRMPLKLKCVLPVLLILTLCTTAFSQKKLSVDICIYGGTSSGVIAAYTAKKMGKSVILIEPAPGWRIDIRRIRIYRYRQQIRHKRPCPGLLPENRKILREI
ncbi:MAG: FAD-dependent oxidoreductase [Bacteroidota bacterium]